jgi:transcriptional regulator with XRE-family HTH domain
MPYRLKADADLAKALGATLRTLRKLRGHKIKGVHKATGLAENSIAAWEQGKHMPSMQNLRALADFYRIRLSALLANTETAMALISKGSTP